MAKVRLDFAPPSEPDMAKLHIYEAGLKTGPFNEIEVVTAIGAYPDYFSYYMTSNAVSTTDWFTIAWETTGGIIGDQSAPIKGGTTTLVHQIVSRVLERDSSLDEAVVTQEAEGAIQMVLGDNVDPYDSALSVNYRKLNGFVYLVLARSYTVRAISTSSGSIESATLGLVSFKSASGAKQTVDVQSLIDIANKELGIGTSFVLQLESIAQEPYITYDHSRLVSGWLSIE